jgi:hypothetical protein
LLPNSEKRKTKFIVFQTLILCCKFHFLNSSMNMHKIFYLLMHWSTLLMILDFSPTRAIPSVTSSVLSFEWLLSHPCNLMKDGSVKFHHREELLSSHNSDFSFVSLLFKRNFKVIQCLSILKSICSCTKTIHDHIKISINQSLRIEKKINLPINKNTCSFNIWK